MLVPNFPSQSRPLLLPLKVPPNSSEQGLSLLECLMAIIVIGLTAALITPPLFLATATRVQNRRAEQAMQLAQAEVDRVQTLVSRSEHIEESLPQDVQTDPGPPTTLSDANPYDQLAPTEARRIDVDGDGSTDYFLQSFRSGTQFSTGDDLRPTEFDLTVRVYAYFTDDLTGLQTAPASLILTSGQGSQRIRPLSAVSNRIVWSDISSNNALCNYHNQNPDPNEPGGC